MAFKDEGQVLVDEQGNTVQPEKRKEFIKQKNEELKVAEDQAKEARKRSEVKSLRVVQPATGGTATLEVEFGGGVAFIPASEVRNVPKASDSDEVKKAKQAVDEADTDVDRQAAIAELAEKQNDPARAEFAKGSAREGDQDTGNATAPRAKKK